MRSKTQKPPARTSTQANRRSELDRAFRQALDGAGDLPVCARERIREDLRLQFDYPGQYVAYIDLFRERDGIRHFSRDILAHDASLKVVQEAVADLSPERRAKLVVHYATDPHTQELDVHSDVSHG